MAPRNSLTDIAMIRLVAVLLLVPTVYCSPGSGERGGQPVDEQELVRLRGSIFLGQVYPSGHVYLDAFGELGNHRGGLTEWPDRILLFALDRGATLQTTDQPLAIAGYLRSEAWVNPPELEGMLETDSPCVSDGYLPHATAGYLIREPPGHPGQTADYFATIEWFGCGAEPSVPLYQVDIPVEQSFPVIAFRPEIEVVRANYSVAGDARPLSAVEAGDVAQQRAQDDQCTLEPGYLDEAKQIVHFVTRNPAYRFRLSSHIEACTSLAEVFVLDILDNTEVVTSLTSTRWRGNP